MEKRRLTRSNNRMIARGVFGNCGLFWMGYYVGTYRICIGYVFYCVLRRYRIFDFVAYHA